MTSVLCIICNPSTTFGQHSSGGSGLEGRVEGEDSGEVRSGLELAELDECGGGSSSCCWSFSGDSGGVLMMGEVLAVVIIWSGRRIGEGVGSETTGLVRNGQLERLVVRRGLNAETLVGLFGEAFGDVFGELVMNLKIKEELYT